MTQDYIQLNRAAQLEKKRADRAFSQLSPNDRSELNILERQMGMQADKVLGASRDRKLTGLGHGGFMELLAKLALWQKSIDDGGRNAGEIARMPVVVSALEDVKIGTPQI